MLSQRYENLYHMVARAPYQYSYGYEYRRAEGRCNRGGAVQTGNRGGAVRCGREVGAVAQASSTGK